MEKIISDVLEHDEYFLSTMKWFEQFMDNKRSPVPPNSGKLPPYVTSLSDDDYSDDSTAFFEEFMDHLERQDVEVGDVDDVALLRQQKFDAGLDIDDLKEEVLGE